MKNKTYEKMSFVSFFIIVFFVFELLFFIILFYKKLFIYEKKQGVYSYPFVTIMVNKQDRKRIYANKNVYIDGEKIKYKIVEDHGKVSIQNKDYYEMILSISNDYKYKNNDIVTMTILKEKVRMINVFEIILEGD